MNRRFQQIEMEQEEDVFLANFRRNLMDETDIYAAAKELTALIEQDGCRKLVLSLGPQAIECLYSVFLAKLVMIQRLLQENGGNLILCDVLPVVKAVFEACKLQDFFLFAPDRSTALALFRQQAIS
jgi:anti-anti-sigma factor